MDGWLKEDFEVDQAVTGRIVAGVRRRVARRRRNQTALASVLGLCFVGTLVGTFIVDGRRPTVAPNIQRQASSDTSVPSPLAPRPSTTDLSLSRVDHSVAITWEGNPDAEYVVYRCSSPRFDSCALADRVKGTQWVDPAQDSGTITFYKVEPRG